MEAKTLQYEPEDNGTTTSALQKDRQPLTTAARKNLYAYSPPENLSLFQKGYKSLKSSCKCSLSGVTGFFTSRFPILSWLPNYNLQNDLFGDAVAGATVAIMHIPQGMAYAMLAAVDPIIGIYMAFFPVLIYAFFGTSRHCSMGTFAVVCLMTGKVVNELATDPETIPTMASYLNPNDSAKALPNSDQYKLINNDVDSVAVNQNFYTPTQVAALVSLAVGFWEIVLGLLQLGSLCVFLSDMLVSGFTTGAAVHVLSSQVKHLFGLSITRYNGPFKLIWMYNELFQKLFTANSAAMVLSFICIGVLSLNNEILKPKLKKYTSFPMPIELIVVVIGTWASYFWDFNSNNNVKVVGNIPTGLPEPTLPPLELFPRVLMDGFVIAIVAYTVSFSMTKIFGKKHGYPVDATQELYALGISNVFGSFFSCAPIAASLSRSLIQDTVGGKTQVTSLISCGLLVFILLFIGPVFETLPTCVLASIILVALKGMFLQTNDMIKMWSKSRLEALVWIVTFLAVVIIDIDYGLVAGVLISLIVLIVRNQKPACTRLGNIRNTDIYLDINTYDKAIEIPGVIILQYTGALHFANRDCFKADLINRTGVDPSEVQRKKLHMKKVTDKKNQAKKSGNSDKVSRSFLYKYFYGKCRRHNTDELVTKVEYVEDSYSSKSSVANSSVVNMNGPKGKFSTKMFTRNLNCIILDLSGISYIDVSSGNLLSSIYKEYDESQVNIILAGISEKLLEMLEKTTAIEVFPETSLCHSVHDAVLIYRQCSKERDEAEEEGEDDTSGDEGFASQKTMDSPFDDPFRENINKRDISQNEIKILGSRRYSMDARVNLNKSKNSNKNNNPV